MAAALDLGTGTLVGARFNEQGEVQFKHIRNMFVELSKTPLIKNMLKKAEAPFAELNDKIYVLGEHGLQMAASFGVPIRRPMAAGVLNSHEAQALPIIREMILQVVGQPETPGETLYYSVPADPVDARFNAVYHEGVFNELLTKLGYTPKKLNEGMAVVYSELLDDGLSGFGFSHGAGMCNVACSVFGTEIFSFSVARSGDWLDQNVATALSITPLKALRAKEAITSLTNPSSQEEKAVSFYYQNMLEYLLKQVKEHLSKLPHLPEFNEPPVVAIAGGTSLPSGFIDLLKAALVKAELPLQIKEIRHSKQPLFAVAQGCLFAATNDE
jgi:hypothetical protein